MNPFKRPKRRVQESTGTEAARPAESDLIAYARAHVTSPGAMALLDEVERGRQRRVKQERLPSSLCAPAIAAMEFGQARYTLPWAMWADADGMLWLHPDYPARDRPGGTASMRVELREDGYHVWPVPGETYTPRAASGYVGDPSRPFIPVAALEDPS